MKLDLSRGHFYKTIEEAETAIKEYSKEHYFVINWGSSKTIGDDFRRIKKICIHRERFPTNTIFLFVGRFSTNKKNLFVGMIPDEYSLGTIPNE